MSAPQKNTGGRKSKTATAPSARKGTRGPKSTAAPGRRTRGSARAEAIRARTPSSKSPEAPSYSNRSARPEILQAARKTAQERGYDRLRLKHITDEAKISHQAFYGHFANKRHAVAVATSDELGAIADLAMRGSQQNEEWAERMLTDIDRTLAATYPAQDGPERWLRDRICDAISTEGGYNALRILELIRISKLGHGEFYRRYGGKRGCLQRVYADAIEEIRAEAGESPTVGSIGEAIAVDRRRARLLVLGAPHLPDREGGQEGEATQSSLLDLLAGVVASGFDGNPSEERVLVIAGGVLEVIRSAVLGDSLDRLSADFESFDLLDGPAPARLSLAASERVQGDLLARLPSPTGSSGAAA